MLLCCIQHLGSELDTWGPASKILRICKLKVDDGSKERMHRDYFSYMPGAGGPASYLVLAMRHDMMHANGGLGTAVEEHPAAPATV